MHSEGDTPSAAPEPRSVGQGIGGGLATALLSLPLMFPAMFVAIFFVRDVVAQLLGRRPPSIRLTSERFDWLINGVGGFLIGAVAAGVAGALLVRFLFRNADPRAYFRTGALAMLPVAIFWAARNDTRVSVVAFALCIWLGSLAGLALAAWETKAAKAEEAARKQDGSWDAEVARLERELSDQMAGGKDDGSGGGT